MKLFRFSLVPLLVVIFGFIIQNFAQELAVQNYIGKSLEAVKRDFGKPVHKDFASENMKCIFYKSKTSQYVFVAGREGVYQAEATVSFNKQNTAKKRMDNFINDCIEQGLKPDTLEVSHYNVKCKGAQVDITLFENKYSKQYQIKVKADKRED